jgi:threonine/homoserine/homoserine lactone efflux protein
LQRPCTIYALLLTLFGIGVLQLVRTSHRAKLIGTLGASAFIAMGLGSVLSATLFPQDPWGSAPTLAGQMHQSVHGVISLLGILYMILIGIWMDRAQEPCARGFPGPSQRNALDGVRRLRDFGLSQPL